LGLRNHPARSQDPRDPARAYREIGLEEVSPPGLCAVFARNGIVGIETRAPTKRLRVRKVRPGRR
jgi:hypothetical protein